MRVGASVNDLTLALCSRIYFDAGPFDFFLLFMDRLPSRAEAHDPFAKEEHQRQNYAATKNQRKVRRDLPVAHLDDRRRNQREQRSEAEAVK